MRSTKSKKEASIPWKDFEELVGKIEHMLVPQNCKVKPNDHIRDSTGEWRQVDASVRIDNGTVEILYIIECRKRKKVSDVTWVEQVAMKARRLGAAKAIIVSNQNLTANALRTAKQESIDIRTLRELPEAFPKAPGLWLSRQTIRWSDRCGISVKFKTCDQHPREIYSDAVNSVMLDDGKVMFKMNGADQLFTRNQIIESVSRTLENVSFPPGIESAVASTEVIDPRGPSYLMFQNRQLELSSLKIEFLGTVEILDPVSSHSAKYESESGKVNCHVLNNLYREGDSDQSFTIVTEDAGKSFILNIPREFANEQIRDGMPDGATIKITIPDIGQPSIERLK